MRWLLVSFWKEEGNEIMSTKSSTSIQNAINIGPVSTRELESVGIATLQQLQKLGYLKVWEKLVDRYPQRFCATMGYALAGAEIGLHWLHLPKELKEKIQQESQELKSKRKIEF